MKTFILLLLSTLSLFGAPAFISAEALLEQIDDPELVIIDVGSHQDYHTSHIPHARHLNIAQLCRSVDDHHEMQSVSQLVKTIESLGITNNSYVVIYDHNKEDELLNTSYFALALHRLGHQKLSILNGSFEEWLFDQKGTTKIEKITLSQYIPSENKTLLVGYNYVYQKIDKVPMIDARVSKFYYGMYKSPDVYKLGHIKGSMSSFWKNSFLSDNTLAEPYILESIYVDGMKLQKDEEIIVYGLNGYQASMNWYILSAELGFKDVKVYDASMKEWGNVRRSPMIAYAFETHR